MLCGFALTPSDDSASRRRSTSSARRAAQADLRRWQQRGAHEELIDGAGSAAPLVDRPYDERLTASAVAGREYARHVRREPAVLRLVVRAAVELHAELLRDVRFGSQEAHREQNQVRVERLGRAVELDH